VIKNYIIGGKHKRIARDVLREKALFRYMQTKYKWTETTIQGIDWAGHKQAVSFLYAHCKESLTKSPPAFLRKFLHGWLATGKMVARYNVTSYPRAYQAAVVHMPSLDPQLLRLGLVHCFTLQKLKKMKTVEK
jgi:hypothetical protein